MKVQNFLHLTPPAVKKQCEVLKGNKVNILLRRMKIVQRVI